jgi:large subunit ribosomal protein L31e
LAEEAEEVEEKEKVEEAEVEEEKVEFVEERVYMVPLGEAWRVPRPYRTPRAVRALREFVSRHMKAEEVKLSQEVNRFLWRRSIEKPPRKVRIKVGKDKDDVAWVYLAKK